MLAITTPKDAAATSWERLQRRFHGRRQTMNITPAAATRLLHAVVRVLVQRMRAVSANLPATGGRLMEGWW